METQDSLWMSRSSTGKGDPEVSVAELARWANVSYPQAPGEVDWSGVPVELRTLLPDDYREMIDTFGGGSFDRHIWIHSPRKQGEPYDLASWAVERETALELLWGAGEEVPPEINRESDRLIAWASTGDGEYIYWVVPKEGSFPAGRRIAVQDYDGDWEFFDLSSTEFLLRWVNGELDTNLISSVS
ncbi:SMI1/KNR4 family protein [Streptomyces spongiicola]|uniref:SMI1/KNR4 family protein n=1 Tax=Streptomyces spongiicola TaxID=1690221 RepID=UPI001C0EB5F2|nr:SMI1/KNR4 family protein [Streptomyces spongiicola]